MQKRRDPIEIILSDHHYWSLLRKYTVHEIEVFCEIINLKRRDKVDTKTLRAAVAAKKAELQSFHFTTI